MLRYRLLLALAVTLACTGDADAPSTTRPSASLTEEVRIDGNEHDLVPFGGVSGGSIAVAEDGVIAISQTQDHVVRFFGADGTTLGSFGGDGQGPGEFERNTRVGWIGDSLWVYDPALSRITVLAPERQFARTVLSNRDVAISADLETMVPPASMAFPMALRAGGQFTSMILPMWDDAPTSLQDHILFGEVSAEAELTEVLAVIPVGETSVRDNRGGSASLPFANRTVHDVSRDGSLAGFARAGIAGEEATLAMNVFDARGDTVFTRQMPVDLVPLPAAVRDSVFDRWIERLQSVPSLADAVRERAHEATHYPPLQDLIIGRDGTVWIALADRAGSRPHLVFASDGELIGELSLSDRSRIAEAERDRIWVIEKDELDVESLVRYGVKW